MKARDAVKDRIEHRIALTYRGRCRYIKTEGAQIDWRPEDWYELAELLNGLPGATAVLESRAVTKWGRKFQPVEEGRGGP